MVGKTISHYQIIEKLGEGGMGVVYGDLDSLSTRDARWRVICEEISAVARFMSR